MSLSDEFMMQRVKEGDTDKLALLFERYQMELYNFFFKFSRDKDLCSDLTQNVFYRILKYRNTFKQDGKFRTWMYMIARNVRIDAYKKEKSYVDNSYLKHVQESNVVPVYEFETKESGDMVKKAISYLNDDKKELIIMSFYLEMSYAEISETLQISENNARVRFHRALTELRSIYRKMTII